MTKVRLPHELIDWIIDHLHDDRAALSACCFVCKAWLASSRYHLFKDICLNYYCDDILALPPPSMFAVAARRLTLSNKKFLPPGIEHFSSINSFYLVVLTPNADMLTRIPLLFSRITLLELNQVRFDSFAHMVQLICALPNLETLTQHICSWIHQEVDQPLAELRLPPRLHTLNVLSLRHHVFLDWFNALDPLPPLSTLRLYNVGEPHVSSMGTAIKRLGGSLQHLTLELCVQNHAGPILFPIPSRNAPLTTSVVCIDFLAGSIDLNHSVNLRSFTLIYGWPKLLHRILLTHARHTQLQHLILTIYEGEDNIPNLDLLDWRELDHFITAPSTAFRLMDFTVRVSAHDRVSFVNQEMVETRFAPLAGAAGMVKFVSEKARLLKVEKSMSMRGPVVLNSWGELVSR
ncbi:hypothetical protein D9615_007150 [Tricholomella constricta]|uniref:F-box domain-containing protein n=1 Tax=Tricholomella constricta TaxID=117010 RepID=A0A8H5H837_9AGAR|nr:hypothetical protein D9615_007150 [Tricholomella constricta]